MPDKDIPYRGTEVEQTASESLRLEQVHNRTRDALMDLQDQLMTIEAAKNLSKTQISQGLDQLDKYLEEIGNKKNINDIEHIRALIAEKYHLDLRKMAIRHLGNLKIESIEESKDTREIRGMLNSIPVSITYDTLFAMESMEIGGVKIELHHQIHSPDEIRSMQTMLKLASEKGVECHHVKLQEGFLQVDGSLNGEEGEFVVNPVEVYKQVSLDDQIKLTPLEQHGAVEYVKQTVEKKENKTVWKALDRQGEVQYELMGGSARKIERVWYDNEGVPQQKDTYDSLGTILVKEHPQAQLIELYQNAAKILALEGTKDNRKFRIALPNGKYLRSFLEEKKDKPSLKEEEYLASLALTLNTPERVNMFFEQCMMYTMDGHEHFQTAAETVGRMKEGKLLGDCDDWAMLAEDLLQRNGRNAYTITIPGHAVCLDVEKVKSGKFKASIVDTTGLITFEDERLVVAVSNVYAESHKRLKIASRTKDFAEETMPTVPLIIPGEEGNGFATFAPVERLLDKEYMKDRFALLKTGERSLIGWQKMLEKYPNDSFVLYNLSKLPTNNDIQSKPELLNYCKSFLLKGHIEYSWVRSKILSSSMNETEKQSFFKEVVEKSLEQLPNVPGAARKKYIQSLKEILPLAGMDSDKVPELAK